LAEPLAITALELRLRVAEAPEILRAEDDTILDLEPAAVETIPAADGLSRAVPREETEDVRQLLLGADAAAAARPLAAVVVAQPHAVVALRQPWRAGDVVDLRERVERLREVGRVSVALLHARLESEAALGIVHARHARAVGGEAEHRVVHEAVADELRRLVVRGGIAVEIIRQVEPPGDDGQPLGKELASQPRFTDVHFVLTHETRRVTIEQRQPVNLGVGRRPAQADDVGEETRVLRETRGKQ